MEEEDYRVVKIFKALSNGIRYQILDMLRREPMFVSQIAGELERDVSSVSHHLRVMRNHDLVQFETQGKRVVYRPKRSVIADKIFEIAPLVRRELIDSE